MSRDIRIEPTDPPGDVDVTHDGLVDTTTGLPILTKEMARVERESWTASHPPLPGLQWSISFNIHGKVSDRNLIVKRDWYDAFAPPVTEHPPLPGSVEATTSPAAADRLGILAYAGWRSALPDSVRETEAPWGNLPEPFRAPMRAAAVTVWQHAENAGYHEALLRTLPAGKLGAAGELDNAADLITGIALQNIAAGTPADQATVTVETVRAVLRGRAEELRHQHARDHRKH